MHLFERPISVARRSSRRLLGAILILFAGLPLSGCEKEKADDPSLGSRCAHDVLEADLQSERFVGPAVDPTTGSLMVVSAERYVMSSTYGIPKPGSDGSPVTERYLRLFGAIEQQLAREPGLLALQLSQSPACGSGRTLALWKSEEQMYAFVTSQPHLDAMTAAGDILLPGYAVTHWEASSPDQMTLEEGVRQLGKAGISR